MEMVAPLGGVYQAGTLSGNPVAVTAGIETLKILKEDTGIYNKIEENTTKTRLAAEKAFGSSVCVNQAGSLMSVFFTCQKVIDYSTAVTSDTEKYAKYFCYMLENGVYIAPSQFEAMFLSAAHTKEQLDETLQAAEAYFMKLRGQSPA